MWGIKLYFNKEVDIEGKSNWNEAGNKNSVTLI